MHINYSISIDIMTLKEPRIDVEMVSKFTKIWWRLNIHKAKMYVFILAVDSTLQHSVMILVVPAVLVLASEVLIQVLLVSECWSFLSPKDKQSFEIEP